MTGPWPWPAVPAFGHSWSCCLIVSNLIGRLITGSQRQPKPQENERQRRLQPAPDGLEQRGHRAPPPFSFRRRTGDLPGYALLPPPLMQTNVSPILTCGTGVHRAQDEVFHQHRREHRPPGDQLVQIAKWGGVEQIVWNRYEHAPAAAACPCAGS